MRSLRTSLDIAETRSPKACGMILAHRRKAFGVLLAHAGSRRENTRESADSTRFGIGQHSPWRLLVLLFVALPRVNDLLALFGGVL